MATEIVDNRDAERYEIRVDGELAGTAGYKRRRGIIALLHTETLPAFRGRGIAGEVVEAALTEAEANDTQVLPFCPFVAGFIRDHKRYLSLVPEVLRDRFGVT